MIAYNIDYRVGEREFNANIDAKNLKSAQKKIARKHNLQSANEVKIIRQFIIGYF